MTNLKTLNSSIPDYAKDIKDALHKIIGEENKALTRKQILGAALAAAYASKRKSLILDIEGEARLVLDKKERDAVRCATSLATMHNVYHRFTSLSSDKEFVSMSNDLCDNGASNHGIDQVDFEIFLLATSVVNGCGSCIDNRSKRIQELGLTKKQVQVVAQIAAVIVGAGQVLRIEEIATN